MFLKKSTAHVEVGGVGGNFDPLTLGAKGSCPGQLRSVVFQTVAQGSDVALCLLLSSPWGTISATGTSNGSQLPPYDTNKVAQFLPMTLTMGPNDTNDGCTIPPSDTNNDAQ